MRTRPAFRTPRRGRCATLSAIALAVGLSGCGGTDEPAASSVAPTATSPSATDSPSATPTPTPTPRPDRDGDGVADSLDAYPKDPQASTEQTVTIICDVVGPKNVRFDIDRIHPDFTQAWKTPLPERGGITGRVYCDEQNEFNFTRGPKLTPVSDIEQAIWDRDKRPGRYTLPIAYSQCVEHDSALIRSGWPLSKQQVPEAETALMLCPGHPNADMIRAHIAEQKDIAGELATGASFYDGNYRVGKRIQPGTYVITGHVSDCYWERLDGAGNIIDNNFVSSALRVEVTVAGSDFSFHSEGCGLWRKSG